MSVNEFIKNMAAAGFTGNFRATNDEMTIKGTIYPDGTIKKVRVATYQESKEKIKKILND